MGRSKAARRAAMERSEQFLAFCNVFAATPTLLLLERSDNPGYRCQVVDILKEQTTRDEWRSIRLGSNPFAEFLRLCKKEEHRIPHRLKKAIDKRTARMKEQRIDHTRLVAKLGLGKRDNAAKVAALRARTVEYVVDELSESYPPRGFYVCENPEALDGWYEFIECRRLPDQRRARDSARLLDPKKLQLIIPANESAIIRDRSGRLIAIILRDFCEDAEVLAWVNEIIAADVRIKRSVRKENPGKLVLVGYSAGARSGPLWDWARNIIARKNDIQFLHSHSMAISSVFALFYQKMRAVLPDEVLRDYERWLDEAGFPRMDARGAAASDGEGCGEYYVQQGTKTIVFHHEKLAPPAAVAGANYSRAIHRENMPHKFGYGWTTARRAACGGNFYIAKYGIKIEQAANTFHAWQPTDDHGTSVIDYGPQPGNPPFSQQGISFVSSMRLESTFKKYQSNQITAEEALKEFAEGLEDGVDEECST